MSSGTTMNLSQSIADFDYIKVKYRYYTGSSVTYETGLVKSSDLQATGGSTYPQGRYLMIAILKDSSSNAYVRNITRSTNTKFQASNCYQFAAGTTTYNSYCIPYQIIGVKRG